LNIFVLDTDVTECARAHCDKHVVKMCLEYAQILSTSARLRGFEHDGYRSTHARHPCVVWAAEDPRNWNWLLALAFELGLEYTNRYGKLHASTEALKTLPAELVLSAAMVNEPPKYYVLAMPEQYQNDSPVESYRRYYRGEKRRFATYRAPSVPPLWFN